MGKHSRGEKEFSEIQKLKHENQKLRRENSSLRKQLARVDLNRVADFKEMLEARVQEDDENRSSEHLLEKLKQEWQCHECHEGHLEIVVYQRMDGVYYFRKCTCCTHRTKPQIYVEGKVKGIKKSTVSAK